MTGKQKYYTGPEIAEYLNVAARTIEKWTWQRRIPHIRVSHRCVRYNVEEVDAWFNTFHVGIGEK